MFHLNGVLAISFLCLTTAAARAAKAPTPLALHPSNPHYFLFRGKPTLLITSGEHYGAVLNLDFDYVRYLDALRADGLNLTRTWSGTYREIAGSFEITDNTLAPAPNRYVCPWARSETPGGADGGAKFDLTGWDPAYFTRLRDFVAQAGKRGVVVEMNLFCTNYDDGLWAANPMNATNNVNGIGACPKDEPYTLKHPDLLAVQDALVRKLVAELHGFDNVYYEVCNEPYFGGVTMEWQRHIVDTIVDAEKGFPQRHLISMNIANDKARVVDPPAAVSIFNFHYATPPDTVPMNYDLSRVIGENETGFRGKADSLYRTEAWEFLMAGGALYNNLDYSFTAQHPDGTFLDYKSPGGGSPTLRRQLHYLQAFLSAFDFIHMAPSTAVVPASVPVGARCWCLERKGHQYALYLNAGRKADLQIELPQGTYRIDWHDPVTGAITRSSTERHAGGILTLHSPEYAEDIALGIRAEH